MNAVHKIKEWLGVTSKPRVTPVAPAAPTVESLAVPESVDAEVSTVSNRRARRTYTDEQVRAVRKIYARGGASKHELASALDVSKSLIGAWILGDVRAPAGGPITGRVNQGTRAETPQNKNPYLPKLTAGGVAEMRRRARGGESIASLASEFAVSEKGAWNAIRGKTWKNVTEPPVPQNYWRASA